MIYEEVNVGAEMSTMFFHNPAFFVVVFFFIFWLMFAVAFRG